MAKNGSDSAWGILSPIWGNQNITPLRRKFQSPMSWVNYRSGFGEVIDRFRWEGGCIAEHVSSRPSKSFCGIRNNFTRG